MNLDEAYTLLQIDKLDTYPNQMIEASAVYLDACVGSQLYEGKELRDKANLKAQAAKLIYSHAVESMIGDSIREELRNMRRSYE